MEELERRIERRQGMSAGAYAVKLAANREYQRRNAEKMRAYKKRARERAKAMREPELPRIGEDLKTGCWEWMGGLNESWYGMVRTDGQTKRRAHRAMWERYKRKESARDARGCLSRGDSHRWFNDGKLHQPVFSDCGRS
jgi:hypothetical protein